MSNELDALRIAIEAELSDLRKGFRQMNEEVKDFSSKSEKSVNSVSNSMDKLSGTIKRAIGAAIAAAAAFASVRTVMDTLAKGDSLAKTADKLGVTTESLIALRFAAAETAGVTSEVLDKSLQSLARKSSEAAQGMGETVKVFEELGISAVKLSALSPDEQFKEVAEAMKNVTNQSDKLRISQKLFEDGGVSLLNTLKEGKDGLNNYTKEAEKLGILMSRMDTARIEAANDAMGRLGMALQGVANAFVIELAPVLTAFARTLTGAATDGAGLRETMRTVGDVIAKVVGGALELFARLKVTIGVIRAVMLDWIATFIESFPQLIVAMNPLFSSLKNIGTVLQTVGEGFTIAFNNPIATAKIVFAEFVDLVSSGIRKLLEQLREVAIRVEEALGSDDFPITSAIEQAQSTVGKLNTSLQKTVDTQPGVAALRQEFEGLNEVLKEAASEQIFDEEMLKSMAESIREQSAAIFEDARASSTDATNTSEDFQLRVQQARDEAEALAQVKMEEQEAAREANLAAINQRLEDEKAGLDAITQANLDAQAAQRAIWESGAKGKVQVMGGFFKDLSVLMDTESKKQFEIGKKAAIAGAVADTFLAANRAYAAMAGIPVVGPGLAATAAAAAILAGRQNVKRIQNTQFGGGGGGGGSQPSNSGSGPGGISGGIGGSQENAVPTTQHVANITVVGQNFGPESFRGIAAGLNDAFGDGVKINVNGA